MNDKPRRKVRSTTAVRRYLRRRQEYKDRLARVRRLRAEIARLNFLIGRIDPQDNHRDVARLTARIRTLQQQIRYINCDSF